VSCEVVMYVIVAASVDANRILVDEEMLILAARCVFIHQRLRVRQTLLHIQSSMAEDSSF